jgi:hypothetical protein
MKKIILKLSNHDSKPLETKYAKFFCTHEMYIMSWEGTEECQKHHPRVQAYFTKTNHLYPKMYFL